MKYIYNKDYPQHGEFLGLYRVDGKAMHLVLRWASEKMGFLRFVTEHGGPPHYVGDPIAWAPLPLVEEISMPLEHKLAKANEEHRGGFKLTPDMERRFNLQRQEFETLDGLVSALKNLPAVVDDDYPEMRHKYDSALTTFLEACRANGRFKRLRKLPDDEYDRLTDG